MCNDQRAWIESALKCRNGDLENLFKSHMAADFLMTWSIFESHCFKRFMTMEMIKNMNTSSISCENLDSIFEIFHDRYQDTKKRRNLMHGNCPWFESFIGKTKGEVKKDERIKFLVYVVYRYRNNMFHGNKGIQSWLNYEQEIKNCMRVMRIIHDQYNPREEI